MGEELHEAVKKGDIAKVKDLLIKGADINYKNEDGWTSLHVAAINNRVEIADFLLKTDPAHMHVHIRDNHNRRPLHYAANGGNLEMTKFLLERGAHVFVRDEENKTPIDYARLWDRQEVLNVLLNHPTQSAEQTS